MLFGSFNFGFAQMGYVSGENIWCVNEALEDLVDLNDILCNLPLPQHS